MSILVFTLNLPWTVIGSLASILSWPQRVAFSKNPPAVILHVKSFWWYRWLPGMRGVRAIANGHVVQLSTWADEADLRHELIHVEQHMRYPLISGFVFLIELIRHGPRPPANRFEKEACERAGNRYGDFVS